MAKIKDEYRKQRKLLQNQMRRMRKRGYTFPSDFLPELQTKPKKKDVKELENLRKTIYKRSKFLYPGTGKILTGEEGRKFEKKKQAYKHEQKKDAEKKFWTTDITPIPEQKQEEKYAQFADTVIYNYRQLINGYPDRVADIVFHALDEAIKTSGKLAVAMRLETTAEDLGWYLNNIGLFGDSIAAIIAYCSAVFGDLPGMTDEYIKYVNDILDSETYEG